VVAGGAYRDYTEICELTDYINGLFGDSERWFKMGTAWSRSFPKENATRLTLRFDSAPSIVAEYHYSAVSSELADIPPDVMFSESLLNPKSLDKLRDFIRNHHA
jgi:hypothetical protein